MSFLKSILFGSKGSYNMAGIPISFENRYPCSMNIDTLQGAGLISKVASQLLKNPYFHKLSQGYTHVFVHEMSHALSYRLLHDGNPSIFVFTDRCEGLTRFDSRASKWKTNVVNAAGPMGDIAFGFLKLIVAEALKNYLPWPATLFLKCSAIIWISGELLYIYTSIMNQDGDFGEIAKCDKKDLAFAVAALAGECALGIFATTKLGL
jgi:hypothetical protein